MTHYFINGQLVTEQRYKAMERLNNWLLDRKYSSWEEKISVVCKARWFCFEWDGEFSSEISNYLSQCKSFGFVR